MEAASGFAQLRASAARSGRAVTLADARVPGRPLIYANRAFEALTGYTADEVIGRSCAFLQGDDTDPDAIASMRAALDEERHVTVLIRNYRKNGTRFWNELSIAPVLDPEGEVTHFIGIQSDVTSRVEAEISLRESEERYRSVINSISEGVVMQSATGEIIAANRQAERILGLTAAELRGQSSLDRDAFSVREDGSPFPGEEHPAMVALRTGEPVHDVVMGVYDPGGELRWISVNSEPMGNAYGGRPTGVVTSFADITQRRRREEQRDALRKVAEAIAAGTELGSLLSLVCEQVGLLANAAQTGVWRFGANRRLSIEAAWSRDPAEPAPEGTVEVPEESPLRRLSEADTLTAEERDEIAAVLSHPAALIEPIPVGGKRWGAFFALGRGANSMVAEPGVPLGRFTELIGMAIASEQARIDLASRAERDPLTGLANHRVFHERLGAEIGRATRHRRDLSLVLLDVDNFKQINDRFGHQRGDEILSQLAERLQQSTRAEELVCRVGGDEFALMLPETAEMEAYALTERARALINEEPLDGGLRITCSAGICGLEHASSGEELIRLADGALYWSKDHGRDQTSIYDPNVIWELSAQERADHLQRSQALLGIRALARAIDAKDPMTHEHSERVAALVGRLASIAGWDPGRVALLREAALVHDIGKIGIPDQMLLRPGPLEEAEYELVKRHAALGADIVADCLGAEQVAWVRSHHERPDGLGYPDGLHDEEIPEGAALLAVADVFDVMTAARPYQDPTGVDQAVAEIEALAGEQFRITAAGALRHLRDTGGLGTARAESLSA